MKIKLKFLVRRKMRRWGGGKGPLTKEQIDCLDEHIHQEYWHYSMFDIPRAIYDFEELNKLLEKEEENNGENIR